MPNKLRANHHISADGRDNLGGTTTGPGLSINWRGNSVAGAEPVDLIEAALDRLMHLQTTRDGGDKTARQTWEVQKCLLALQKIDESESSNGQGSGFGGTNNGSSNNGQ